jgi:hypothetical protein
MTELDQPTPGRAAQGVSRTVWLRLFGAVVALAAGAAALVVVIDLVRATLP